MIEGNKGQGQWEWVWLPVLAQRSQTLGSPTILLGWPSHTHSQLTWVVITIPQRKETCLDIYPVGMTDTTKPAAKFMGNIISQGHAIKSYKPSSWRDYRSLHGKTFSSAIIGHWNTLWLEIIWWDIPFLPGGFQSLTWWSSPISDPDETLWTGVPRDNIPHISLNIEIFKETGPEVHVVVQTRPLPATRLYHKPIKALLHLTFPLIGVLSQIL